MQCSKLLLTRTLLPNGSALPPYQEHKLIHHAYITAKQHQTAAREALAKVRVIWGMLMLRDAKVRVIWDMLML